MKVSIIVPVYNIQDYVSECVDSILAQTYKDIECILVDDGSSDRSSEICEKYAKDFSRFVCVIHKHNGGLAAARNTGLQHATGDYVYFLDGDDKLTPDAISHFVDEAKSAHYCDFVIGHMASFVDDEIPVPFKNVVKKNWVVGKAGKAAFVEICKKTTIMMGVRGLYSKDFLIKNNLFFQDDCRYSEDQEWTPRIFEKAQSISSNEHPDYLYRMGRPGSLMNTLSIKKMELTLRVYDGWYSKAISLPMGDYNRCLYNLLITRYWSLYFHYTPMVKKEEYEEFCEMMERRRYFCMYPKKEGNKTRRFIIKHFKSRHIIAITKLWKLLR